MTGIRSKSTRSNSSAGRAVRSGRSLRSPRVYLFGIPARAGSVSPCHQALVETYPQKLQKLSKAPFGFGWTRPGFSKFSGLAARARESRHAAAAPAAEIPFAPKTLATLAASAEGDKF